MKKINVGSDFSGVGAFNQAISRIKEFDFNHIFACDMDKFARQSYIANYGEPGYYPENVYDRKIPMESLDIYMTSPPCQSFSLAGKRKGKDSKNGVLFFNSHDFIKKNKPRFFIFENVKGLLSDDSGRTFQEWINWLGGKSVNGLPILFKDENSVDYHIYWRVLNSKNHGVPQNRERVFIVGIRDDADNNFHWPKEFTLKKRLKDVLEINVDEKFYLSDNAINRLCNNDSVFSSIPKESEDIASTVCASDYKIARGMNVLKVNSATKKGYELATENDSINLSNPNSETRRGRVGKEVAQTLDTSCNQGVMVAHVSRSEEGKRLRRESMANGKDFTPFQAKQVSFKSSDVMNCVTTATTKDNLIIDHRGHINKPPNVITNGIIPTLRAESHGHQPKVVTDYKIRRLTPRECFRLQDFPDTFKFVCSDSQLYKQAGNSITVRVLELIIRQFKL
jgi:DNA (cytosine-5)-methyltransferase 1